MSTDNYYQNLDAQTPAAPINEIMVPDNKLAKLMYYLDCVIKLVDFDLEKRYYNYNNYYLITKEEEQTILKMLSLFNPSIMENLSLFVVNPSLIPVGKENEFYDINNNFMKIQSQVYISGRTLRVKGFMACNRAWIGKYYYTPIQGFEFLPPPEWPAQAFQGPYYTLNVIPNSPNTTNNNVPETNNYTNQTNHNNQSACSSCKWCLFIVVVIILCILSLYLQITQNLK